MLVNVSLADCGNITGVNWSEGNHNVTIWGNDSNGNENHTSISFTIDFIGPDVTINSPTVFNYTQLDANFSLIESFI